MIKMTVGEALISTHALNQLGQTKYPFQPAMTIAKNKATLAEVGKEYEPRRLEQVKKFGKVPEGGGDPVVPPEKQRAFNAALLKIQEEEIELELKTVSYADLKGSKKELDIEPNVLEVLMWMITMEGQKSTQAKKR